MKSKEEIKIEVEEIVKLLRNRVADDYIDESYDELYEMYRVKFAPVIQELLVLERKKVLEEVFKLEKELSDDYQDYSGLYPEEVFGRIKKLLQA